MRHMQVLLVVLVLFAVAGVAQESVNLGTVLPGTTATATYTLRNSNSFDCTLEAVGFGEEYAPGSGAFLVSGIELPMPIAAGDSVSWTVQFRPTTATAYQASMRIRLRCGIFSQNLTVTVSGSGGSGTSQPLADLTVTPPPDTAATADTGCGCTSEIGNLTSQINSLTSLVQTQLAPALQQIQSQVALCSASTESQDSTDGFCPGPFPTQGGQRFLDFVTAQRALTVQAAADLPLIQSDDPKQQAVLVAGAEILADLTTELDAVVQQVLTMAPSYLDCFDSYVPEGTTEYLYAVTAVASDPTTHPKLRALFEESGMETAQTVWDKAKIWVGHIPLIGSILQSVMEDIEKLTGSGGDTLGIAGLMFQYEIERKLDGIIYGLFGIEIPPNATEAELMGLLRRISGDSVTGRLDRLEQDEADQTQALDELSGQVEQVGETASEALDVARDNQTEIAVLEDKVCCFIWAMNRFGQELGDALYGDPSTFSDMIPAVCEGTTYAQCFAGSHETGVFPPETERDAIKPEIRALEDDMATVKDTLERIIQQLGGPHVPAIVETPDIPTIETPKPVPEETTMYDLLMVTKKIYVYAEDVFAPASSSDVHDVVVTTPAFDLSGWIDGTQLRPGDELQVELTIRVAGQEIPWLTTTFVGGSDSRLIAFDELSGGRTTIVGSWIRIRLIQTTSADDFDTSISIGYQFIVESQQ